MQEEEYKQQETIVEELSSRSSFSFHLGGSKDNETETKQPGNTRNPPFRSMGNHHDGTTDREGKAEQKEKQKKRRLKLRARSAKTEAERKAEQTEKTLSAFIKKTVEEWSKAAATSTFAILGIILLVLLLLILLLLFMVFANTSSGVMAGSYQSKPAELDGVDARLTEKELDLQKTIDNIETDHPGFDEYHYDLDPIGHDPFALINYLSARNGSFSVGDMEEEIGSLFDEMYTSTR